MTAPVLHKLNSVKKYLASIHTKMDLILKQQAEILRLMGPFGVPMPDETLLVQTIHGVKYLIDPTDIVMAPNLIIYRQWEAALSSLLLSLASPNSVFVDVGANFGSFSCLLGSSIGNKGTGKVMSFEPNPKIFTLLKKNTSINWSMCPIELFNMALGDGPSRTVELYVPRQGAANGTLTPSEQGELDVSSCLIKSLDSVIPPGFIVDIMKIDVEGHEHEVLAGSKRVVADSPNIVIIIEWSKSQMHSAGYTSSDMVSLFSDLDLHPFKLPEDLSEFGDQRHKVGLEFLDNLDYGDIVLLRR